MALDYSKFEDPAPAAEAPVTPEPPAAASAEPEEGEAPEAPEEGEEPEAPEEGEAPEAPEEGEEQPAATQPQELPEDAEIKVGKNTYKVKDLVDGQLMRADYTRKTQEIARKETEFAEFRIQAELQNIQQDDFVSRMDDPDEVINEFATAKPEVLEEVERRLIARAIHLQGLTPEGRELFLHKEQEQRKAWQAARDARVTKAYQTHTQRARAAIEARKNHGGWRTEAMKAAGLDPANDAHHDLVMDGMASPRNRGQAWSKEMFDAEAARVAKVLGAKAPKAPKPPKAAAAPPAPPKPALPPVRASGHRAPAARPAQARQHKARDMGSFFDSLRSGE